MKAMGAEATTTVLPLSPAKVERQTDSAPADQGASAPLEYALLPVSALEPFRIRDLRPQVCERLRGRIAAGYNPARPLTVVRNGERFLVADGNHRLHVLCELGIEYVPCVIRDDDPYTLAVRCNEDEETYAPMDLFDWLDIIGRLRDDEGLTQAQVAERIGWSRKQVADYCRLTDGVVPQVLALAKEHQEDRGTWDVPHGTFNFTEGMGLIPQFWIWRGVTKKAGYQKMIPR